MATKQYNQRRNRTRAKIVSIANGRPRLTVYRSNRNMVAQIIDDQKGVTLAFVSSLGKNTLKGKTKTEKAMEIGELVAKKSLAARVKQVVFDKGAYKYHGRVKAVAEGARKGGLDF